MFEIGTILNKENYTQAAIACNKTADRHIEKQDGQYVIVENAPITEPTIEERVAKLEAETGLTRAVREMVLVENSGVSDYVKAKAREIETLAAPLREAAKQAEQNAAGNEGDTYAGE